MNLDESIQKHAEWKLKFRAAISRKERWTRTPSARTIAAS